MGQGIVKVFSLIVVCIFLTAACTSSTGVSGANLECQMDGEILLCQGSLKSLSGDHEQILSHTNLQPGEMTYIDLQTSSELGSVKVTLPSSDGSGSNMVVSPDSPGRFTGYASPAENGITVIFESQFGSVEGVRYQARIQRTTSAQVQPSPTKEVATQSIQTEPSATAPPEPTEAPTPSVAELLGQIEILETALIPDFHGDQSIVGIVRNNSSHTLKDLEITVELFDSNGALLEQGQAYASYWRLLSGRSVIFRYYPEHEDLETVSMEATVADLIYDPTDQREIPISVEVSVQKILLLDPYQEVAVTGVVSNPNDEPLEIIHMSGLARDSENEILTTGSNFAGKHYLMPGEVAPFRVLFRDIPEGAEVASVEFLYLARQRKVNTLSSQVVLSSEPHTYIDHYDYFNLVGTVVNQNDQPVSAGVVAAVMDTNGEVLDVVDDWVAPGYLHPDHAFPFHLGGWEILNATSQEMPLLDLAQEFVVFEEPAWIRTNSDEDNAEILEAGNLDWSFDGSRLLITGDILSEIADISEIYIVAIVVGPDGSTILGMNDDYWTDEVHFEVWVHVDAVAFDPETAQVDVVVWGVTW
jgi:hypothetical protein